MTIKWRQGSSSPFDKLDTNCSSKQATRSSKWRGTPDLDKRNVSRRSFLANGALSIPASASLLNSGNRLVTGLPSKSRSQQAFDVRITAARAQSNRKVPEHRINQDETTFPKYAGSFAKGLPQNAMGDVEPNAYKALLVAMASGQFADFERIPRSGGRTLSNPQAAFAFHLEGGDSHSFESPMPPSIMTEGCAPDIEELYWQSLCRDIPFANYRKSSLIRTAAKSLGATTSTIFRGLTQGDTEGPYVSQFLLKPIPYGAGRIEQRYNVPTAGSDFMTTFNEWAQIQAGFQPWRDVTYDPKPRYIRNGRDLAEFAHYDFAYQAYLGAALILVNANAKSIHNCNQFKSSNNPYRYSTVEDGFATFGPAEAADWIGRVTTAALKAAYYQKWALHRRLRPEALAGLIHKTRTGLHKYPLHSTLMNSAALEASHLKHDSYLLSQAYPEGSPLHPSFPSGHAAVAGACSIILKACFDGSMLLPNSVQPSEDGLMLEPCLDYFPTVNDEINKLAFNMAMGRDWAGIHYRTDSIAGLLLGEDVGLSVLQDLACTYSERFGGFVIKRFDGNLAKVTSLGINSLTTERASIANYDDMLDHPLPR